MAELIKVVDEQASHETLNSPVHIADGYPLFEYLVSIHFDELLGHTGQKSAGYRANFGALASGRQKLIKVACQKRDVPSCPVFQHKLKTAGSAYSRDCRRRETEDSSFWKLAELLVQARLDLLKLFNPRFAVAPWLKSDEIEGVVTGPHKAEQTEANNARGVLHTWSIGQYIFNLFRRCAGAPAAKPEFWKLHVDVDVSLVFIGQKA